MSSILLVCCQVTTERMIRQQLQEQTGVDVSDRKAFIKQQVTHRWQTTFFGPVLGCTESHRVSRDISHPEAAFSDG